MDFDQNISYEGPAHKKYSKYLELNQLLTSIVQS